MTNGAVAKRLGRQFLGIEMAKEYIKIGLRRLKIRNEFNGERLFPLQKTYIRRNGRNHREENSEATGKLFGVIG